MAMLVRGPTGDQGDVPVALHQGVDIIPDGVLTLHRAGGGRQLQVIRVNFDGGLHALHLGPLAGVAVVAGGQQGGDHGRGAAPVHREIRLQDVPHPQGILRGVGQGLVARHAAHRQKVDVRVQIRRHDGDGVVGAGVHVQNDLSFLRHGKLLSSAACRRAPWDGPKGR